MEAKQTFGIYREQMKIALYSDLHVEMALHPKIHPAWGGSGTGRGRSDLAGDIDSHTHGIEWGGTVNQFISGAFVIYSSPINSRPNFMFSTTAASICSRHEPTLPVWFGSRLFVHSERIATRISC